MYGNVLFLCAVDLGFKDKPQHIMYGNIGEDDNEIDNDEDKPQHIMYGNIFNVLNRLYKITINLNI